jgi:hypothetical protein
MQELNKETAGCDNKEDLSAIVKRFGVLTDSWSLK